MSSKEWVEIEVTVTDQANRSATRHIEYHASDSTPEKAVGEFIDHACKSAGSDRIHDNKTED